jgi:hypothetical protein
VDQRQRFEKLVAILNGFDKNLGDFAPGREAVMGRG